MMQKEQKAIGYSSIQERKSTGAHYTPKEFADFVVKQTVAAWSEEQTNGTVRILDPAVGDGALLISALKDLSQRGISNIEVYGFDTDKEACLLATRRLKEQFPNVSLCLKAENFAVNLAQFPRAASYLNRHREILEAREYVLKAGRNWFEIWVSHNPNAWAQPKVVFRDIAEKPTFFLDLSGAVVNGDCYWLASKKPAQNELLWLVLAVGNSSFIEKFYDYRFNNKLYAGRRRFITQYVEKFPLPDPKKALSQQIIELAKEIYKFTPSPFGKELEKELDQLVWQVYGFTDQKNHVWDVKRPIGKTNTP